MGILVNFIDRFFKDLQNKVSDSFINEANKTDLNPYVIDSMNRIQRDSDRLNSLVKKYKLDKNPTKGSIISDLDYKKRKEVIKEVKKVFDEIFVEINDKGIEKYEIQEYLKKQYNKSDLFCEEFLDSYNDRIEFLKYEKELESKISERHKIAEIKKEKEKNKIKALDQKYGKDISEKILKGKYWKGMTKSMLIDSLGAPGEKKENIYKENVKIKFYYNKEKNQLGNMSYCLEVSLENGIVVGWKDLNIISKRID